MQNSCSAPSVLTETRTRAASKLLNQVDELYSGHGVQQGLPYNESEYKNIKANFGHDVQEITSNINAAKIKVKDHVTKMEANLLGHDLKGSRDASPVSGANGGVRLPHVPGASPKRERGTTFVSQRKSMNILHDSVVIRGRTIYAKDVNRLPDASLRVRAKLELARQGKSRRDEAIDNAIDLKRVLS